MVLMLCSHFFQRAGIQNGTNAPGRVCIQGQEIRNAEEFLTEEFVCLSWCTLDLYLH